MGYRAALVDFDGTLADSMPYWMDLPWKAFRRSGLTPPEDFAELLRSAPMWEVARQLSRRYPDLSPDRPLEDCWLALMEENYLTRVALNPGALELLALLRRRGLKIVVLSATRQPMLGVALEHFGLPPHIDAVLSEAEVGSKRSRAPYEACGERLGCPLSELLLIEDAAPNLECARALGLGTVGVYDDTMAGSLPLLRQNADVYLEDFSDLSALEALLEG